MFSLDGLGSPKMNGRKLCLDEMREVFRLVPMADLSPGRTNSSLGGEVRLFRLRQNAAEETTLDSWRKYVHL